MGVGPVDRSSRRAAVLGTLLLVISIGSTPPIASAGSATTIDQGTTDVAAADRRQIRDLLPSTTNVVQAVPSYSHHAYLKPLVTGAGDSLGESVAMSGNTIVVGAPYEDSAATTVNGSATDESAPDAGAAYVFVRNGATWSQQAYLKSLNAEVGDRFGWSVAISGDTIVVGALWEDGAATGVNGLATDNSAPDAGAAYVFTRSAGIWSQQAYLKASNTEADDSFGISVAISGETIVVGAAHEDSNAVGVNGATNNLTQESGAAYVFTRGSGVWVQHAYLKASNTGLGDLFGASVAISGDTIVAGAYREDSSATGVNGNTGDGATEAGAAYVFARADGGWSHQAYLKASNTEAVDLFGLSVAISGGTIVVGAYAEDSSATGVNGNGADNSAFGAGAAYVFTSDAGSWSQQAYLKASNTHASHAFGSSVAISADTVVVGAVGDNSQTTGVDGVSTDSSATIAGAAYVFARNAGVWAQRAYLKASNTSERDEFGFSAAVSGASIVVGAHVEDSAATGVNSDGSDDSAPSAGAAYVYGPPCATSPFGDVPTSHPFCAEIEWMSQTGISRGFGDDTYRPAVDVTRQAMSAFLARFAGAALTDCSEPPPFSDVAITHPFCEEIKWMKDEGISIGFDDGTTYRPTIDVTRQAMSAFLSRVAGVVIRDFFCDTNPFSDVPTDHPFCREINWMKQSGISTGFDGGTTYRPSIDVTRQAMSAFLYRLRDFLQ